MNDLKNKIKDHYLGVRLSDNQFFRLEKLRKQKGFFSGKIGLSLAASFVLILIFFFYPREEILQKIAQEVIYNHKKFLPSEFLASRMTDLNARLVKLDFDIISSSRVKKGTVVGGRYCSVQGKAAAQIKIEEDGETSTLYQSNFLEVNRAKLPYRFSSDGVEVIIWIEDEILFAKAKDN